MTLVHREKPQAATETTTLFVVGIEHSVITHKRLKLKLKKEKKNNGMHIRFICIHKLHSQLESLNFFASRVSNGFLLFYSFVCFARSLGDSFK